MSVFVLLLKETGARFGEGFNIRWQDLNPENNTITITPLKGSYARQLRISPKLMGLLNGLKRKWPTYIFRNSKVDLYKASKRV